MGMLDATRSCFSKFATFSGRASRPEYWWFVLAVFLLNIVAGIADSALFGSISQEVTQTATGEAGELSFESETGPISALLGLIVFLPTLAAAWRRMHDTGRSGLTLLIPLFISLATLSFLFLGIGGFALLEKIGMNGEFLRSFAASLGIAGFVTAAILQLVLGVLILWWLTRPGQTGENKYGPQPAA